ncbi:unnamed protein product (macronuclear) [Paramecium tetraurelia]|uniref:Uncharacterized protein n=1 Tax=Paramecium tetraurelia TaxID=5888 RepID=A0BVP5_PARTE|nr:uncharacterized protein GSPATT00032464001 [Paramecium tetraurelia]CAK62612.1 unnamed protein product [Paramecium tetraurelia]|eukprot:XP_001430010.1 hypothetical protein (macronuclear) [Paramecium tetraurelia strain d4-2]
MEIKLQVDNLIKPIKEIIQNIDQVNSQILQSHTQQFALSIIEFVFLGNCCPCTLTPVEYKTILIQYVQQLRKHYQNNKESTACQIVSKLLKQRQEHGDREQEGFMNSDEEETRLVKQISFQQNIQDYSNDADLEKHKVVLQQKDYEIATLKVKLQLKEQKLLDLASGYLKDLQNMREQMYKKSDDFDYYEVSYFDVTDIEDPRYRDLVNNKIANLKSQYETKTREIYLFVQKQKNEVQNLRQTVGNFEQKMKLMENVEYLMNRVFALEQDPYKIWRYIQDIKGNDFFHDVFEKQKPASGIRYREVNKLLMVTKAYDRELEYFKKGIEDQMYIYLERACGIINLQNQDLLDEIEELKKEAERVNQFEGRVNQQIMQSFEQFKKQLKQHQEEYMDMKSKELQQLQKIQLKYATRLWYIVSQIKKGRDIKELILYAYQNDYEKLTSQQFLEVENNYLKSMIAIKASQEEIVELNNKLEQMGLSNEEFKTQNSQMKVIIQDLKAKIKNHQKCLQQTIKHIDSKINPEQLNLEDNNRETTISFKDKLKQLRQQHNGLKFIQEVNEQYQKNNLALDFLSTSYENKAIQTMIGNVNKSLAEAIEIHETHSNKENIHEDLGCVKKESHDEECQTDLIDVEELIKQTAELKQQIKNLAQDIDDMEGEGVAQQHYKLSNQQNQSFDNYSSQKSGNLKRRYVQANEFKDSNPNYQNDLKVYNEKNNGYTLGQPNQLIILHQQQSFERIAQTQTLQASKHQQKGVFSRLFEDSKKKSERIQKIKNNLELLEQEHWQQVAELVKENQDIMNAFKDTISTSKHFYQKQLKRSLEIEQKYFPQKHNRAKFYFKKFKDFHVHQQELNEIFFDPNSSDEKTNEIQRLNIKSVVDNRKLNGQIRFNGLKREEYQFFQSLERKKLQSRTFRSTQQSPKQKKVQYVSFNKPFIGSLTSNETNDFNNQQIVKHLQKVYDLG